MPGQYHLSVDRLVEEASRTRDLGIPAILLFGLPETKDETGSSGYDESGVVQEAIRAIKEEVGDLLIITDVCLCEYTSHGHCGLLKGHEVDNDATLEYLARQALSHENWAARARPAATRFCLPASLLNRSCSAWASASTS